MELEWKLAQHCNRLEVYFFLLIFSTLVLISWNTTSVCLLSPYYYKY